MTYKYLSGLSKYPIYDIDNLLDAYEHIGEEMYTQALTFIGEVHGLLHRLHLKPFNPIENRGKSEVVYYPHLTPLQLGESVDIATKRGILVLAG